MGAISSKTSAYRIFNRTETERGDRGQAGEGIIVECPLSANSGQCRLSPKVGRHDLFHAVQSARQQWICNGERRSGTARVRAKRPNFFQVRRLWAVKHSNNQKTRGILGENSAIDRCRVEDIVADSELGWLKFNRRSAFRPDSVRKLAWFPTLS